MKNTIMFLSLGSLLILSCTLNLWLGCSLFSKKNTKKYSTYPSLHNKNLLIPSKKIKNPLVIIVACIKYNIEGKADLPGTKTEVTKMTHFFEKKLGYKVVSTYIKHKPETEVQKRKEIEVMLNRQVDVLKKSNHDGVIFVYSGHGENGTILDSFGKTLSIYKIKDKFSATNLPEMAGKPKIFLFSKCRGPGIIEPLEKNNRFYHPEEDFIEVYGNVEDHQVADNPPNGGYMLGAISAIDRKKLLLSFTEILMHLNHQVQEQSKHKETIVQKGNTNYKIYLLPNSKQKTFKK